MAKKHFTIQLGILGKRQMKYNMAEEPSIQTQNNYARKQIIVIYKPRLFASSHNYLKFDENGSGSA